MSVPHKPARAILFLYVWGSTKQAAQKTFYLETFGCQMNVHDSEKVVGTLVQEGYRQVETVEEAGLVLYNTCSIRDKAEQKVFHRLADYKKYEKQGKKFGVLGCVAQQEGEKIFERAPHVSLVCGSASYRKLPEMLVQLENATLAARRPALRNAKCGRRLRKPAKTGSLVRITGLDDRQTDECFETEFTARTNPHRGYITIIEGCDKFCAYCVVPFTRGKERSRTSRFRAGRSAADGRSRIHRNSAARAECEFVQRSGREAAARTFPNCWLPWERFRASDACGLPLRIRATLGAILSRPSMPCRRSATTCICRCRAGLQACSSHAAAVHARRISGTHRLDQSGEARYQFDLGHHCGLSGRNGIGFRGNAFPAG